MRIREKGFSYYGMTKERAKEICVICREPQMHKVVKQCAEEANGGMADYLTDSLTDGLSYNALSKTRFIPLSETDFYAYRRKAIYLIGKELERRGG